MSTCQYLSCSEPAVVTIPVDQPVPHDLHLCASHGVEVTRPLRVEPEKVVK